MSRRWEKSGIIERDNNDIRAPGALARFFVGGTTTPLTVYSDAAETTPHAHPLEADGNGRWPTVFIPFCTSYDEKVTTSGGTQLYYPTLIPNPDPVEASEDSVDDAELIQTGMIVFDPAGGTKTGFVRCNGRTIGSAASGATERANADTEALYTRNYNAHADSILAVSGGRGASAAADFAANKPMALFNMRSGGFLGVDDMGNSAEGIGSAATYTTGNATTGGSIGGKNDHTLTTAQLASHEHSLSGLSTNNAGSHGHSIVDNRTWTIRTTNAGAGSNSSTAAAGASGTVNNQPNVDVDAGLNITNTVADHAHTLAGNATAAGGGTAHNNVQKSLLGTFYQKL